MPNALTDDLETYVALSRALGRDPRRAAKRWIAVNGTDDEYTGSKPQGRTYRDMEASNTVVRNGY